MRVDLEATSGGALQLLFDSSLRVDLTRVDLFAGDAPPAGACLVYSNGSDGTVVLRVFVDEEPEAAFRARAARIVTGRVLRVPDGHLVGCGSEDVPDPATGEFQLEDPADGMIAEARIPAGTYEVEAFDFDPIPQGCLSFIFARLPTDPVERELRENTPRVYVVLRRLPEGVSVGERKSAVFGPGFSGLGPAAEGVRS